MTENTDIILTAGLFMLGIGCFLVIAILLYAVHVAGKKINNFIKHWKQ